jgi:hypothetical protein
MLELLFMNSIKMSQTSNNLNPKYHIFKKFIFFCVELKKIYRFADMKTTRVYNWSWRTSSADAVRQAII